MKKGDGGVLVTLTRVIRRMTHHEERDGTNGAP